MDSLVDETVEYDAQGRMYYHAEYHDRHGKPFTVDELVYLCKYYEFDSVLDMSLALGRTPKTLQSKVVKLRQSGMYEIYKNMELIG